MTRSDCDRFRELLSLRADGLASDDEVTALSSHLPVCAPCRAAAAADRAAGDRLRERAVGPVPAGFSLRVVAAVARENAARIVQNRFLRRVAAAAMFVAAVATGATVLRERADTPSAGPSVATVRDAAATAAFRAREVPTFATRR